jgi:SET domain-containing protein
MKFEKEYMLILEPSNYGVGVFAVDNIPQHTNILSYWPWVRLASIKNVPEAFRKYALYVDNESILCPQSFEKPEIGIFINHSFNPNLIIFEQDKKIVTLREIKAGEELLSDYNQYNEPEYLKDSYYQR